MTRGGANGSDTRSELEAPDTGTRVARADPRGGDDESRHSANLWDVDDDRDIFGDAGLGRRDDDRTHPP
jgi:hypothetical protein